MLSTLIYRSRSRDTLSTAQLEQLEAQARERNQALQVTGILLFDGTHFFQVLEGPDAVIDALYARICQDPRHVHIVQILRDYAPTRRFGERGMELFDVREFQRADVLGALASKVTGRRRLPYDDRVMKIIGTFAQGNWQAHFVEGDHCSSWRVDDAEQMFLPQASPTAGASCQFALQPIVEPGRRQISSLEALIRSADGGSPAEYFATIPAASLHEADLASKTHAFELARAVGIGHCKLSINLLPMSLVTVPQAIDRLLAATEANALVPEQIIVEVTEEEVIPRHDEFAKAVRELRGAGFGVAIDDFGAGFAGLSLLAEFQPEKLKLDRRLITGIHADGPRQAIVRAVLQACNSLGISVVAEGVETIDEWCWLEAAGVERFQGFLFAAPKLNGVPVIQWPRQR